MDVISVVIVVEVAEFIFCLFVKFLVKDVLFGFFVVIIDWGLGKKDIISKK